MKVGIDIGGSHIAVGVVDNKGKLLEKSEKRLTSKEKKDIKKSIEEYIIEQVTALKNRYKIEMIGIGIPGWDDNGIIVQSGNLGIKNYNIIEALKCLELPIKIRNDAKCAALAEKEFGVLKGYNRSIFLTLGTGIGGAAFVDDKLLEAGKKPGYEFGHIVIKKDGIHCQCGRNGCFEKYASMKILKNNLREALGLDETTRGQELLELIRRNSPDNDNYDVIESVISEYVENLSVGILNLINIFEPEVVGLGGSFVYFEDVLLDRLKKCLKQRADINLSVAVLGNDAGIIGAVL